MTLRVRNGITRACSSSKWIGFSEGKDDDVLMPHLAKGLDCWLQKSFFPLLCVCVCGLPLLPVVGGTV